MRSLLVLLLLAPRLASAQAPCDATCDRVIEGAGRRIDGASIGAGETVCVRGGTIPTLAIADVHGTEGAHIVVRACDAPLVIGEGGSSQGISIVRSSHLRVTGGEARSIRIVGGESYSVGVSVGTCTDHVEVDGLEVSGTSYTAYRNLSEDDGCVVRDGFSLHGWHIHDVGGEGMFFGANSASTPYHLTGVEVWGNRIERTGMQGIKIGVSVEDAHVHDNVVIEPGARDIAGEDTGISGGARRWRIERNVVARSSASCAFVSGTEVTVANNLFLACGGAAISMNGAAPIRARIVHNTIVAPGGGALNMWASAPEGCALGNNLLVDLLDPAAIGVRDGGAWTVTANLVLTRSEADFASSADLASAGYAELSGLPFALRESSPARDAGSAAFLEEVSDDVTGVARDGAPDVGAHEVGAPAPDAGPGADAGLAAVDAGRVLDAASPRDAAGTDAGRAPSGMGGCHASRSGTRPWGLLLLLLLVVARRR